MKVSCTDFSVNAVCCRQQCKALIGNAVPVSVTSYLIGLAGVVG